MGIVDIRVRQTFLRILKSSVENLGFDERQRVMAYYYAKHGVINMSESYDGFNAELNAVVNSMLASKDITGEQLNKAGSALADRLCWLFLLGGKRVLWRLFQLIQEVSAVMPIVIRAFIDLRPALHARVDQNQTTLIMAGLKRLLDQTGPANNNQRTELITKFALELINATLVDATAFIKICLLSGLTQNQSIEWAMASLSYLNALLNNNHVHIDWTNYLVDEDDDNPKEDHWEEDCSKGK